MSKNLEANDILAGLRLLRREAVEVEELGGTVYVRELTAMEVERWGASLAAPSSDRNTAGMILAATLVDGRGLQLFAPSDAPRLGGLPRRIAQRLAHKALELSELVGDDLDEGAGADEGRIGATAPDLDGDGGNG